MCRGMPYVNVVCPGLAEDLTRRRLANVLACRRPYEVSSCCKFSGFGLLYADADVRRQHAQADVHGCRIPRVVHGSPPSIRSWSEPAAHLLVLVYVPRYPDYRTARRQPPRAPSKLPPSKVRAPLYAQGQLKNGSPGGSIPGRRDPAARPESKPRSRLLQISRGRYPSSRYHTQPPSPHRRSIPGQGCPRSRFAGSDGDTDSRRLSARRADSQAPPHSCGRSAAAGACRSGRAISQYLLPSGYPGSWRLTRGRAGGALDLQIHRSGARAVC